MSKFFEYVKNIELYSLITESLNTFSYNLPENRKQRLFDFYSFSSLSPLVNDIQSSELKIVKSFAPKKSEQGEASDDSMEETTSFRGARKLNENFVDSFWKAHDKCYVELAKEMLMDIFYCISAEFNHIDQEQNYRSEKLINKIPEDLREIYKSYLSNASVMNEIKVPEKKGESGNDEYNRRYNKSISSIVMAGKSIFDFAKLCSYVYDNFTFSSSYAGPKWSDAANAFIGIANAIPSKYRPASIFKPLGDLKDLKSSTDTKSPESTDTKAPSEETEEPYDYEKTSLLEKEKNVKIFKQKYDNAPSYEKNTINSLIDDLREFFEDLQKQDILIHIIHSINGIFLYTGNKPESEDILNLIVNHNNIGIIPVNGTYTSMYEDIQNTINYYFNKYKTLLNELFGKKQTEEDAEEEISNEIVQQKSSGSYELTPKERLALFVAIDHTWGLSHNTGPTFNKLKEFNKLSNDGRSGWLIDALDKRTKDENLFRFINKNTKKSDVSQQMIPIIKRVVYSYYGATNEEELYKYVAKTNPKKQVPVHVSDVVYRYIKGNPSGNSYDVYNKFESPYDIDFKSHYNYWCSLTFKVKYIPTNAVCIIAAHITDHNVTILASDKNDFSFSRDGIQSSGEYVESKNSFALKEGSSNSSAITNTYKKTINEVLEKIHKYNGVRINPDYTSVLGDLEMSFDELKQKINLNSDISLARIAEYGDDLRNSTKVKFQIGDDGLEFIMPHVVMTFVNAERQEETPDVTYGSPDAEEYFSGKRKKPKPAPASSNIRFSFLAKPEISKTFQFTDDVSTNIKNVIYGYVSKINETGDEGLKRLQKSAVEDFNLGTLKIDKIDYHADFFRKSFPEKYKKLFNRIHKNNLDEIKLYGNHNYNFLIKIDKGRLTNPYTVILRKNEDSIVDRSYRYDSIETIEKNFAAIVEDMISNIKDSEKQEFQKILKNADRTNKQTQTVISASPESSTGVISKDRLVVKYGEYLAYNYPYYSTILRNYCIKIFEKIAFSINLKMNTYPLIQYFKKLSILFKWFYDEFDSRLVDENNFEKAVFSSYADLFEIQFKPISNFLFNIKINPIDDYFIVRCGNTKNSKILLIQNANFSDAQGMVKLAKLVNEEYVKMVVEGETSTQPAINNTQNVENLKNSLLEKFINFGEKFKTFAIMADIMFEKSMFIPFIPLLEKINNDKHNIQKFSNFLGFIHHISKITEDSFDDNHIIDVLLEDEDIIKIVYGTLNTINYVFLLGFNKDDSNILLIKATEKDINFIRMMKYDNIPLYNYLYLMFDIYKQDQKLYASEKIRKTYEKSKADFKNTNKTEPLNDSVNLKELLKSFLLKS